MYPDDTTRGLRKLRGNSKKVKRKMQTSHTIALFLLCRRLAFPGLTQFELATFAGLARADRAKASDIAFYFVHWPGPHW